MSKSNSQYIHAHNAYRHTLTHIRTHTNTHIHTHTHTHLHTTDTLGHTNVPTHTARKKHTLTTRIRCSHAHTFINTHLFARHTYIFTHKIIFLICKDHFKHFKILRLSVKRSDIITKAIAMIKRFK